MIEEGLDFDCEGAHRFPALESFAWIGTLHYDYTPTPLHTWWGCINWSKLRTLNLGRGKATELFFTDMTGHLNGLKHLSLFVDMFRPDRVGSEDEALNIFSAFLRAIEGLEILRLVGPGLSVIVPTILSCHAQTLETLSFQYTGDEPPWTGDMCMDVLGQAPKLLGLTVGMGASKLEGNWSSTRKVWTPEAKYESMTLT